MGSHQENAKVFKALCDPKRLAILEQLRSGEKCACVLQGPLDLTQSGLSYHMKILCDSGGQAASRSDHAGGRAEGLLQIMKRANAIHG